MKRISTWVALLVGLASTIIGGVVGLRSGMEPIRVARTEIVTEQVPYSPVKRAWMPWWDAARSENEADLHHEMFEELAVMAYVVDEKLEVTSKIADIDQYLKRIKEKYNQKILVTIYNEFDPERVHRILTQQEAKAKHLVDLLALVEPVYVDGLELDYEYLKAEDKVAFSLFVADLAAEIKARGKILSVTVHPKVDEKGSWQGTESQDWNDLAQTADEVVVMVYDYHWSTSKPGPIAPIGWFSDVVDYAVEKIPANKLVIGLPAYAYDWEEGKETAASLTLGEVYELEEKYGRLAMLDEESQSLVLEYEVGNVEHEIWAEGAVPLNAKMMDLAEWKVGKVAVWRIGNGNEEFYEELGKW